MTLTEKIEQIVLPSLRNGLEMEEKMTPAPWMVGVMLLSVPHRNDAAGISHIRNEWRKVILTNILAIEGLLEVSKQKEEYGRFMGGHPTMLAQKATEKLQSIANLWPDEV